MRFLSVSIKQQFHATHAIEHVYEHFNRPSQTNCSQTLRYFSLSGDASVEGDIEGTHLKLDTISLVLYFEN